jgi:DNA (cytosine-5)-methyltransferase 1
MRHGSLFSGIGGFDLAAEWMGWENVFHCEWNEFGRKILNHHFPEADSFEDITKTDFRKYEGTIDLISGGFPCQPFSLAGKRKGTEDERYLWHEMLRAIQEIKPKFVIAENVYGIVNIDGGMVFEQVCLDLENEGYEVQPFVIPACAKDAPHRRDRVWFVAYSSRNGERCLPGQKPEQRQKAYPLNSNSCGYGYATDTKREGLQGQRRERKGCSEHRQDKGLFVGSEDKLSSSNTKSERHQRSEKRGGFEEVGANGDELTSRPLRSNWEEFPIESPLCRRDDGLSERLDGISFPKWRRESIKAYGNAIVPQVAFEIFKALSGTNC